MADDNLAIPEIPEPGTYEYECMIDRMRTLEKYSGLINAARKNIESRGLNFDEEFEKWRKNHDGECCP